MVDRTLIGSNPVAVVIVALVSWVVIRLAFELLRKPRADVKMSAGSEADDDGAQPEPGDHVGDAGHRSDAGKDASH